MRNIVLTLRKFKRNKSATLLGLLGLATGLVCVLYIVFWINDEISFDRFHKNTDRIFVVHAYLEGGAKKVDFAGCPPMVAPAMKAEYPEVENSCRYLQAYVKSLVVAKDKKSMIDVAYSDPSLFDIFTLPFIYGNQGNPNVASQIVFTRSAALRYFGNVDPVGKIVRYNNQMDMTVTGVIEDFPCNSTLQFDAVIPVQNIKSLWGRDDALNTWYNNAFMTFGLLKSPSSFEQVAKKITRRIQKDIPESTNYLRAYLFKNGYLYEQKHIRNVKIFGLVALLVLLAATLNFINLITARSTKQARETGLRKTIGASRANIVKLVYADVAIVCLLAYTVALVVAYWGLPFFGQTIGKQIEPSSLFSVRMGVAIVLCYAFTVLLAGSYPALFLSSFRITETLSSNFQSVKGRKLFRNSLLFTIFTVSIVLIASTFIISKQTLFMQNMDIGYNKEQLLYISLDGKLKEKAKTLKNEIGRLPGVIASTATSNLPTEVGNNGEGWDWQGKDPNFKLLVTDWGTDEDMVKTLQPKLIEGSFFSNDIHGIVINKAFADAIGWKSFVGKNLTTYGQSFPIVGVIDNIQYNSLSESCRPMAIQQVATWWMNYLVVKVDSHHMDKTIGAIRKTCEEIEPDFPFNYGFVSDSFAKMYQTETNLKKLVSLFSILSIVVLCLGLLGVVMFMAEQKTKEIGVRKCLGEKETSIAVRFIMPILVSGIAASVVAVPLTWHVMNRWLENYANRIELDIWIFLLAVIATLAIAVFTVAWQSWRVATRNPVEALRYE
ncbi:MAG TPA: ABC transporter permease [Paludibacter sp.]|nr:ABC transporter permease [Paludibacter sp.]